MHDDVLHNLMNLITSSKFCFQFFQLSLVWTYIQQKAEKLELSEKNLGG